MKKLWVFEWNDKWNSYADGSPAQFISSITFHFSLRMRNEIDDWLKWKGSGPQAAYKSNEIWFNGARERRQRHSIINQSNQIKIILICLVDLIDWFAERGGSTATKQFTNPAHPSNAAMSGASVWLRWSWMKWIELLLPLGCLALLFSSFLQSIINEIDWIDEEREKASSSPISPIKLSSSFSSFNTNQLQFLQLLKKWMLNWLVELKEKKRKLVGAAHCRIRRQLFLLFNQSAHSKEQIEMKRRELNGVRPCTFRLFQQHQ